MPHHTILFPEHKTPNHEVSDSVLCSFLAASNKMLCAPGYTGNACGDTEDPAHYCSINSCHNNTEFCKVLLFLVYISNKSLRIIRQLGIDTVVPVIKRRRATKHVSSF